MAALLLILPGMAQGLVDLMIRNRGEVVFAGANVFDVARQTREQVTDVGWPAVYEFQVRHIGSLPETIRLEGTRGARGWTVRYFDAFLGGAEITAQVASSSGYAWPRVTPGTLRSFRLEVTPDLTVAADDGWDARITVRLESAAARRDTARALTGCAPRVQPDLMVRRPFDVRYAGDGVYNLSGNRQTKAQETDPDVAVAYLVRLANDGNLTDRFTVTAPAAAEGWQVRCFDALVGGAEITDALTGAGWVTPELPVNGAVELRLEVSGSQAVQGVSLSQVHLSAVSGREPGKSDAVRSITAIIPDSTLPQAGFYTQDEDFERGALTGTTYDRVPHQLELAGDALTLPFIWVPNSNEGTVSKVDTRSGRELARYRTGPERLNGNPSRTTIDQQGNCWVANRHTGTAVKIGLLENGQALDRNGDGLIQTSRDLDGDGDIAGAELLPWGADECVLWEVLLRPGLEATYVPGTFQGEYADDDWSPGPRGVAVDAQGNVWVGTYNSKKFYHLEGSSGRILRTNDFAHLNHTSYGAVIDPQGILWSSGLDTQTLLRLDPTDHAMTTLDVGHVVYGLGLDRSNHLFVAGWRSAKLSRLDARTGGFDWTVDGVFQSRGVAVTADGDVWTADSGPGTVTRWANEGYIKATIPVGSTPTGVSVDADGKVWVVNYGDEYIKRIDPLRNEIDLSKRILGGRHYGYSDMTGIISRTATTRFGAWSVIHDSRYPGAEWGTLSWTAATPEGTRLEVRARSSSDRQHWSDWETPVNSAPLRSTPPGKFLEVEVTFQALESGRTPVLYDLTVAPRDAEARPPVLRFTRLDPGHLELAWDLDWSGAMLEEADRLTGPWRAVEGLVLNRYLVDLDPAVPARFFRLRATP